MVEHTMYRTRNIRALLVIDLKNCTRCYGDSLTWSLPANIVGSKKGRGRRDKINGANIIILSKQSCDAGTISPDSFKWFYPLQSCSLACMWCYHGVHACWNLWLTCGSQMHVPLLSNPSINSGQLTLIKCQLVPEKIYNLRLFFRMWQNN